MPGEKQVTTAAHGHVLTNIGVWSPDSRRIVYDVRSDPAGSLFDGRRIETVDIATGEVKVLYESRNEACCGVATYHPGQNKVVFILGPENPTVDWQYSPAHRQGVVVEEAKPGTIMPLDARDLMPPFTPGALRGGSHVHVWSGAGEWVSFTYEDHVLSAQSDESDGTEINLRTIGVSVPIRPVGVGKDHVRNHDGSCFSVVVARVKVHPRPGSDEISKAVEEGWVGANGYIRHDGSRQKRALAFQGQVRDERSNSLMEVFIVDLPEDVTAPSDGPLEGTTTQRPRPPKGTVQRRLTFTANRRFPGLQGPRHWLRSSPDGSRIAFLMRDDDGVAQIWTISPNGSEPVQLTHNHFDVGSAFSWSPDGARLAHVMDNSVCVTDTTTGETTRLTPRSEDALAPRPEACVFSPNGKAIAYVRPAPMGKAPENQIFVCEVARRAD